MKNIPYILFLPLWVFLSSLSAFAADFQGKGIHVADDDTITISKKAKEKMTIRLNGLIVPS